MPLAAAQDYPVWINATVFMVAGFVVWIAGTALTRYVDGLAAQTRLGHVFAGMLLLGGITSLPEAANTLTSAATGNPRLGINNLLGSAAINVLLLAIADALVGRAAVTSVLIQPSTMMMGILCMLVLIAVAAAAAAGDLVLVGHVGAGSIAICAMSVMCFWISAGYDERSPWSVAGAARLEPRENQAKRSLPFRVLVVRTAVAAAAIFAAGYALSQTGDALAVQTGVDSGLVGFALIGVATSLPELTSILTAFRIRRYEMAFGQVLGTNFVNLSLVLLADLFDRRGPVFDELGPFEIVSALLAAMLTGVFMVGLLEHRSARIMRMGYDSFIVMMLFAGGLVVLATMR